MRCSAGTPACRVEIPSKIVVQTLVCDGLRPVRCGRSACASVVWRPLWTVIPRDLARHFPEGCELRYRHPTAVTHGSIRPTRPEARLVSAASRLVSTLSGCRTNPGPTHRVSGARDVSRKGTVDAHLDAAASKTHRQWSPWQPNAPRRVSMRLPGAQQGDEIRPKRGIRSAPEKRRDESRRCRHEPCLRSCGPD